MQVAEFFRETDEAFLRFEFFLKNCGRRYPVFQGKIGVIDGALEFRNFRRAVERRRELQEARECGAIFRIGAR